MTDNAEPGGKSTGDPEADLLVQAGREYVERGLDELLAYGQPPDTEPTS